MEDKKLIYKIALSQIEKIGSVLAKNLVSYCGGVEEVFSKQLKDLIKIPGINEILAKRILNKEVLKKAEKIITENKKNNVNTLFYLDENYPSRLKNYNDSPIILYTKGTNEYNNLRTIAIVGTRDATSAGKYYTEKIIEELLPYNVTIVSGLAFGIDATAHKTASKLHIPNIAIMGSGINVTYPAEHEKIRNNIEKKGDIISEFELNKSPERGHFPMRNRIIAQLSDAMLVVESGIKGGAMITAKLAFDYNKDVFAIPGRIDDPYSKGTNWLIKANIAALVDSGNDISKMMNWDLENETKPVQMELFSNLSKIEEIILDIIRNTPDNNIHIDKLHYESRLPLSELSSVLLELEFKSLIENLPGSRYGIKPGR
ncbi:MAG: DNA-processing protein DprA [Saprospiraceae bacterium]